VAGKVETQPSAHCVAITDPKPMSNQRFRGAGLPFDNDMKMHPSLESGLGQVRRGRLPPSSKTCQKPMENQRFLKNLPETNGKSMVLR